MSVPIQRLQCAIQRAYHCDSLHLWSEPVEQSFDRRTGRAGLVEVFSLVGHPLAKRCYAWLARDPDGIEHCVTVLAAPPISSAAAALALGEREIQLAGHTSGR